ncbi:hypothetical protein BKA63DRAFT_495636 [Paraphoma chrysanthemicola]|nr:hypothetical protein BKA63DRAFT_495636 [Paraphoma chrysanthemicola]
MFHSIQNFLRPTPSDHFSITAVVAPTRGELESTLPFFDQGHMKLPHERVTFDIEMNKIPPELRCSCLASGGTKCLQEPGHEHWVVEWETGSVLETNEDKTGKKIGKSMSYEDEHKGGKKVRISPSERVCCIDV